MVSPTTPNPQGSPRIDPLAKNNALKLAVLKALEEGITRPPEGESDSDEWTIDDWNDEPLSPETLKRYQEIFAKNAAKLAKAKASQNQDSIFG